jgi:hypothetical protein
MIIKGEEIALSVLQLNKNICLMAISAFNWNRSYQKMPSVVDFRFTIGGIA